jgi:hypothetical protein
MMFSHSVMKILQLAEILEEEVEILYTSWTD